MHLGNKAQKPCYLKQPKISVNHQMTSRRSMLQEDTYFRVLRILHDRPDVTQREIALLLGVSTSGLNYCLNALIDRVGQGVQLQ